MLHDRFCTSTWRAAQARHPSTPAFASSILQLLWLRTTLALHCHPKPSITGTATDSTPAAAKSQVAECFCSRCRCCHQPQLQQLGYRRNKLQHMPPTVAAAATQLRPLTSRYVADMAAAFCCCCCCCSLLWYFVQAPEASKLAEVALSAAALLLRLCEDIGGGGKLKALQQVSQGNKSWRESQAE
jgi:hypothetical protein